MNIIKTLALMGLVAGIVVTGFNTLNKLESEDRLESNDSMADILPDHLSQPSELATWAHGVRSHRGPVSVKEKEGTPRRQKPRPVVAKPQTLVMDRAQHRVAMLSQ